LCDWPTADAVPLVAELVATAPTKTIKVLALRGLVRLMPQAELPASKKFEMLKTAMAQADRDEERRLVLSGLGNVPDEEALALAASCLDNPVLRAEACLAAVAIAEKLDRSHDARVAVVMAQVAKATTSKDLAGRANALARRAKD
jgi:hypothetical protein